MNMSQSSRRGFVTYIENSADFVVSLWSQHIDVSCIQSLLNC